VQEAVVNVLIQLAIFYCLINILIQFMVEGSILQWFLFTNMVMAAGPGILWMKRGKMSGSREGASIGLALLIVAATVNTFHPVSMWVLAMPEVFNTPWYYISGVVFTFVAAFNAYQLAKLPPKNQVSQQKRPIW
jgi:FtsH-binding integral membrane protein